jgi:hypothetical protein
VAFDDHPVQNDAGAAFVLGVTAECLKKWRQRKQGPDYIQYGPRSPVRYELNALMEFRDKYRVKHGNKSQMSLWLAFTTSAALDSRQPRTARIPAARQIRVRNGSDLMAIVAHLTAAAAQRLLVQPRRCRIPPLNLRDGGLRSLLSNWSEDPGQWRFAVFCPWSPAIPFVSRVEGS